MKSSPNFTFLMALSCGKMELLRPFAGQQNLARLLAVLSPKIGRFNRLTRKGKSMFKTSIASLFSAALVSAAAFVTVPSQALAQAQPNGYVQSSGGSLKSGFGLCWRTGYWTPQMATAECDPDLVGKAPAAPAAKPGTPPAPTVGKVSLKADTLFDFDKSVVKPEGKKVLDGLATQAKGMNLEVIIAVGHTDSKGSDAYNQKLSERRAAAVKAYLVSQGIPAAKINTQGRGESKPIADNKTDEGRAKNRRVEIEVVGTKK
jgi:OOP family OmpA-OmpF porin